MQYQFNQSDLGDLEERPVALAETIPAHWYTNSDLLKDEIEHVLKPSWQYVGHLDQLMNPGDYFSFDLLGLPIIVVRSLDGVVRSFANVCRHRGGPLVEGSGTARMFRCQYHGWSYSLQGQLAGSPQFDGAEAFDKKNCKLHAFDLDVFEGMIFVRLGGGDISLGEQLGSIKQEISPIQLQDMKFLRRVIYPVDCNWKVYIDNYMEGYHIESVHPGLAKILDMTGYVTSIDSRRVLQKGPIAEGNNAYHTQGHAYYYQIFPNLMFNIMPGRLQVNAVLPRGVNKCDVIFDFYLSEADEERAKIRLEDDLKLSELVQREDAEICKKVQRGLDSGCYSKGRISPSEELGLWHFQNQMRGAYKTMAGRQ